MIRTRTCQRGSALVIVLALIGSAFLIGPLLLHFGQKRHNRVEIDISAPKQTDPQSRGQVFASTLAAIIRHELSGHTGWRPNDFFLWGPGLWADNNANRQLGIIQAARKTMSVFKDHLTKVSSEDYDPNLITAEAAWYNQMNKFWFPSAETKLEEGVRALETYVSELKARRSKPINERNVELIRLFQAWTDMLGDAHANLFRDKEAGGSAVPPWRTDDYFYHAQGFAHVMHHMTRAAKVEYAPSLRDRPAVLSLFDEVAAALGKAAQLKPLIVLDGSADGLFANHRRNLDVYLVEARQKMYSIREELEK